jgi:hypothetical protein
MASLPVALSLDFFARRLRGKGPNERPPFSLNYASGGQAAQCDYNSAPALRYGTYSGPITALA